MRGRDWLAAGAIALATAAGIAGFAQPRTHGLSIDLLFWLRDRLAPAAALPPATRTAVVAIDEETYRTPPFKDLPNALWTREIAPVLDALVAGGAAVVGFDVIFPTSVERLVPRFDRDFLIALHDAAGRGKVVLGYVQHQKFPILPFAGQVLAVGGARNLRAVNLLDDPDDVIRRLPLTFRHATGPAASEPSLALELAARAVGGPPTRGPDGALSLAGHRIPGSARNQMLIDFPAPDAVPTYSLADLGACAQAGNAAFFRRQFAGKVVLFGAVLDVEDRKLTSQRFVTAPEHPAAGPRCVKPPMTGLFRSDLVRTTIPGVYIHAAAIENLLAGNALVELDPRLAWMAITILALSAGWLSMRRSAAFAGALVGAGTLAWTAAATVAFAHGLVVPLIAPPLAAFLTLALLYGYRFAVSDRDRRLLRASFSLYLAPTLVERLIESDRPPQLGGEEREVTVMFSDVAGFTALSEGVPPADLVGLMNDYLTAMTDIIESEGGFVDKYIGDGIVALFGAPVDEAGHARHAVRAALACQARLAVLNCDPAAFRGRALAARIGLASGPALVGNVGSRRRFNYTAMGDVVNLASRLEGANKVYGTAILASEATRRAAGDDIAWREIDRVTVVGRDGPVSLFEPLAPEAASLRDPYGAALAAYRAGRFDEAAAAFESLAPRDGAARAMAARARRLGAARPAGPWDAVTALETK